MPTYCYKCRCGKNFEVLKPMSESSELHLCPCGKTASRDLQAEAGGVLADGKMVNDAKYPYESHRLPVGTEGCETSRKGHPVVRSKAHEREIMAKHGYSRD